MEGCQERAQDVQPAWWLDLKATSEERMCCADGYESILGFSFPCCHQTLLHLAKITMSSWHSLLPIHMICPHTTFPRSLFFSAQRFCTSTKDTCLDVSLTGTPTTSSIYCCCSLFSGWPGHFYGLGYTLLRTPRLRLSVLVWWNHTHLMIHIVTPPPPPPR